MSADLTEWIDEPMGVPTCESIKIGCVKDYYEDKDEDKEE